MGTRRISEIAAELNDQINAAAVTDSLIPTSIKAQQALTLELAEAAASLEARLDKLEAKAQ